MPDRKIQVEHAGAKLEVEIPAEWIHKDEVGKTHVTKEFFETEVGNRLASATKGRFKPEELMADEAFLKTIVEQKKEPIVKLLGIKPNSEIDVQKVTTDITERVRREEVKPLQDQTKGLNEENDLLRVRSLDAEIAEAAIPLRVPEDLLDLVKIYVRERMKWDGERKQWFVKNSKGDGFEVSTSSKAGGHPYMGARELMEQLAKSGTKKSWFGSALQPGGDYRGGGGAAGVVTLEQFQALSPSEKTKFYQDTPDEFRRFMALIRDKGEQTLFDRSRGTPATVK